MKRPPNFVFVCSDQHSARWTGYDGHPVVQTPNLDRLASEGVVLERAYSLNPVCTPARTAMMTGMFASDCESYCNSTVWNGCHPTWGTLLAQAGYACFATGKFDLNDHHDLGFNTLDARNDHCKRPDITSLFRRPSAYRVDIRRQIDGSSGSERTESRLVENTLHFMNSAKALDQPWAIYTGLARPHPPFVGPQPLFEHYLKTELAVEDPTAEELEQLHPVYRDMRHSSNLATPISTERIRKARAAYFASITELDEDIGLIRRHLEKIGQLGNTIFIYTSDHGESLGCHGLWMKSNFYDESVRVPMLISGPGLPGGKRFSSPVTHADLVATILDFGGAPFEHLRGVSLRKMICEGGSAPPFAFSEFHGHGSNTGGFMVQRGPWKYVEFTYHPEGLLYNLDQDPHEKSNRFGEPGCAEVLEAMRALLRTVIDPESVTEQAFACQFRKLRELTCDSGKEELVKLLESRLGRGQAVTLAHAILVRKQNCFTPHQSP